MVHEMKLRSEYFNKIKNGTKIYEIRLNDEKRQLIDVGDVVIFKEEPELKNSIQAEVKNLLYFSSFDEMAESLPNDKIGFENQTKQQTIDVYHQFYSVEDEQKYGVVAIKIEVLK